MSKVWSGIGMVLFSTVDTTQFDTYVDELLAAGISDFRVDMPNYQDTAWLTRSKAAVVRAIAKGARVTWGVSSNNASDSAKTITSTTWTAFHTAILSAAAWAQSNGVYEFQLGNEEESHNDDTTLTDSALRANIKSTATEVQAIFTNGNVSYTPVGGQGNMYEWSLIGLGDIDLLPFNLYHGDATHKYYASPDSFEEQAYSIVGYFGARTYVTEFGLNVIAVDDFSTNQADQAAAIANMITILKAAGITRANFFHYGLDDNFGIRKANGSYRQFWRTLNKTPMPVSFM